MSFPDFFNQFPLLDVPISEDIVTIRAIRSDQGLVAFFTFHKDFEMPPHSHGFQWGTVIKGQLTFTIDGNSTTYGPGDKYLLDRSEVHAVKAAAGTQALDVFEEPDRYPLKA